MELQVYAKTRNFMLYYQYILPAPMIALPFMLKLLCDAMTMVRPQQNIGKGENVK